MQQNRRAVFSRIRRAALCALALVLLSASALAQDYPYDTIVNANVNMRRNASSSAIVLERLKQGEEITVLGVSGNYYRVKYAGRTGYIMKQYVVDATTVINPETASGYPYYTTTADSVNLREMASVKSTRLTEIPKGATIQVHGVAGSFASVTYGNYTGYAMTAYLNMKTVVATPTPTPAVMTSAPGQLEDATFANLQKGDTGSAVRALQEALIELGFLNGAADGKFGSGTENALLLFQQANAYPVTGVADANLQAFLYNGTPKNASGKKTEVKTLAPIYGVAVRLNDRGELVENIQTTLKRLGYYAGSATGVYDAATRTAVRDFQKKHGLTVDGVCGKATQEKLFSVNALAVNQTATPTPTATPKPTPTPTVVPVYETPGMTVRRGDNGNDAKLVQARLKELGYYTGKVDGKFWDESVDALKKFQKAHGLSADGVAGKGTYAVLFHYSALAAGTTATPKPTSVPTPTPTPKPTATPSPTALTQQNVVTIRLGTTGEAVRSLQQRLTQLGYYTAVVDGVCKADDVAAIKLFQKQHGLTVDGVAGYDTQSRLYGSSAQKYAGASNSTTGGSQNYTTLRKGMTGTAVKEMQQRLITLGYLNDKADGKYGTNTAEAVYLFQKANGLIRDGIAGGQTLAKLYSSTATKATPAPTATPKPTANNAGVGTTVRKGDSNAAVKTLQEKLITLGYLSGKADGIFGMKTYQALVNFQRANRLTADGIAGSKTWGVLTGGNAVGSGSSSTTTPTVNQNASQTYLPRASAVKYENWYNVIRAHARKYPYATVYDYNTGISWQVHMFSLGKHADAEPVTAADTAKMLQAFGGKNTWNPKPVWVILADGTIYMASTHSMPHEPQHNYDNNFDGHLCIHFPRTASQVAAIGPYATSHQKKIDEGWKQTQAMIK